MNRVYLLNYAVKGIKNLDEWAELSFYKKIIRKPFSVRNYNVKGIYGMNGAGKSGIIRSVEIMKRLLGDPNYLHNSFVQKQLNDLINKLTKTLEIKTEFLHYTEEAMLIYRYEIRIEKNHLNDYAIAFEKLSVRKATSGRDSFKEIYHTESGILYLPTKDNYAARLIDQTKNLLMSNTLPAAFIGKEELIRGEDMNREIRDGIVSVILFVSSLFVCMDQGDDHRPYYLDRYLETRDPSDDLLEDDMIFAAEKLNTPNLSAFAERKVRVIKDVYPLYEKKVERLSDFIRTFKNDLVGVEVDKRDDDLYYICSLVMKYKNYSIDAEFESTGIKKLIRTFDYFDKMMRGGIVFIDELDSNLHDVYLCALLEYLMDNAEGQLCFTTHNIGPMDVLKKNKKSIDFLSADHKIYSWISNGNYSPSSLYKNGMIEGSAFNVFSFDFAGAFYTAEDDR